ncbi:MAG: Coenzyme F420 hydrogenase/dehydrogenase, beta subunit C-terminal domain [Acidimicrobiales bacterium]
MPAGRSPAGSPASNPAKRASVSGGSTAADELGPVVASHSARASRPLPGAQDGGVVTALLAELIGAGHVDGAIVSRRIDAFRAETVIATTPEELVEAASSVYHQTNPLAVLNKPRPAGTERLAFVGTPCQVNVLRALQAYPWPQRESMAGAVVLTVARVDVRKGELLAYSADGRCCLRRPVSALGSASLRGCDECADFSGLGADLAVGSLGSSPGRRTVIVRTEAGRQAWSRAQGTVASVPLTDLSPVVRAAARNRRRADESSARGIDPSKPLWISYGEHLGAYAASDRAPVAPPPYRSQHYDITC